MAIGHRPWTRSPGRRGRQPHHLMLPYLFPPLAPHRRVEASRRLRVSPMLMSLLPCLAHRFSASIGRSWLPNRFLSMPA
eukprot:3141278-Alexandrium_andersonii.AAC.1